MHGTKNAYDRPDPFCSLIREQGGSVVLYVTIALAVLMGMAALAIDVGRIETTSTQAKQAADAAAIAAASQLTGDPNAITRATNAAQSTPLIQNRQTLGTTPGDIAMVNIRFLTGLPPGDPGVPNDPSQLDPFVTTNPLEANFVEVTTEQVVQTNMFIRALGSGPTSTTSAISVAGNTVEWCQTTPFVICNPDEIRVGPGAPFDLNYWIGKQFHIKASGSSAAWTPGDFGLADVEGVQSAPEIARALAEDEPDLCVRAGINIKPGQTQSTRTGLNTRFDMYENPFFGNPSARSDPKIPPAPNIRKGMVRNPADSPGECTYIDAPSGQAKALPRDATIIAGTSRFGQGVWNCQDYWNTNFPGKALPAGCTSASTPATKTRYGLYKEEIDGTLAADTTTASPAGETGQYQCHAAAPTSPERRVVYFAWINCIQDGPFTGNSAGPIDVKQPNPIAGFLTEPVGSPPNFDTFLEVVDPKSLGTNPSHNVIQLYR